MVKEVSVQLNLAEELASDEEFRKHFFRLQVQNDIAQQIIQLRALRGLRQVDLALLSQMKQSAISRVEQADYASWNYQTLLRVVEALNARLKVVIEPIEEAIKDFKEKEGQGWDPQATICSAGEANLLMPQLEKASDTRIVAHRMVAHDDPRDSRDRERDQAA